MKINSLHGFNTKIRRWKKYDSKGELPEPRDFHASIIFTGFLTIFGGTNEKGAKLNSMYACSLKQEIPQCTLRQDIVSVSHRGD